MIIVDVETTGLNPYANGIISIGAVNFLHPDQYFYADGRPHNDVIVTNGALNVNGYTHGELYTLQDSIFDVMNKFIKWVNDQDIDTPRILAGHNIAFDYHFLLAEMDRNLIDRHEFPFKHRTIDLHTIAQTHYIQKKGFQYPADMPADFIQEKLGLPREPTPHHALNGAVWEAECISRLWFNRILFTDFEQYPVKENPWR